MAALTSALTALGTNASISNIRDEVDRLQDDVPKVVLQATPEARSVYSSEGTPAVKVDAPASTATVEPQPSESSPKEDATVDDAEAIVQEGVDAVQCMVAGDENPNSPIFLSDMVKVSKKRKKNGDGGPSKKNRPSESNVQSSMLIM
ncbi:hypothetical protein GOP47_0007133 [Adiantum capillus-veneris]|uniref:Uncharacterized protein n=1 Tax=Adiantum capillus-veneris TaxID=13818 RepID=A0A9D4V0C1_ADICA|nr:hypothetical protein GOP47_0007133 [Adiantum capillus-veneris]